MASVRPLGLPRSHHFAFFNSRAPPSFDEELGQLEPDHQIPDLRAPSVSSRSSGSARLLGPAPVSRKTQFVAPTVFGARVAGNTEDFIQSCICTLASWESHVTDWIGERLAPGGVFVDVGANIGYYS